MSKRLRYGGRRYLDETSADLSIVRRNLLVALRKLHTNPGLVEDALKDAMEALERTIKRNAEDLAGMLERDEKSSQSAIEQVESQIDQHQQRIEALETQIQQLQTALARLTATEQKRGNG